MSNYRRSNFGQLFFFTVVTHHRRPILTTDLGRKSLRDAFRIVREKHPFSITAIVLLPDHLHSVWKLPRGDQNYSLRWRRVKEIFSKQWLDAGGTNACVSKSREKRSEQGVWQRRLFEHTCRDDRDLERCVDYVHVNPLKHGLVNRVVDWPYSSFHRYLKQGHYSPDWGNAAVWYGDELERFE